MKRKILVIVFGIFIYSSNAQLITCIQATQQQWYGGVCCSYGTNYVISFESNDTIHNISIDTIWIGNKFYTQNTQKSFNVFSIIYKGKMIYQITVTESWNKTDAPDLGKKNDSPVFTLIYNGEACVVYHVKKKRKLMPVERFIMLAPIAYP